MSNKIWFITGVSSGFGRAISEAALAQGDTVVGTLRKESEQASFEAIAPCRARGVLLDVTDDGAIAPTVERVEREIGPIDVLVNNAGYGHEGLVEESSLDDVRRQFAVNVFGAVAVTKAVLPFNRKRRSGRIINITSMGSPSQCRAPASIMPASSRSRGFPKRLARKSRTLGSM
jgi:NAD(P)-dependent dehydrogenase (short-subunit alcohol dehydrogenase family)